jgi:hypothetical protein
MPEGLNILTHSRMECFQTCRRKHYYQYMLGIRRERTEAALRFGTAIHLGLDWRAQGVAMEEIAQRLHARYSDVPTWADERAWWTEYEQVVRLLFGYDWYWGADDIEILATEQVFELPICNPETGGKTPSYVIKGKTDKRVRLPDSRVAVQEHKTTSKSIASGSDYWKKARLSQQVTLYYWADRELGNQPQTIIWDAIHKPGMRPYDATPPDKRKYKRNGGLYASCREKDESPREYGNRLLIDIADRPEFYYARQEIPRTQGDIDEFLAELWDIQKAMRDAELNNRHYRRTSACTSPYRCEFLDVCHGGMDIDHLPDGFIQLDFVHPELLEDDNDSNSGANGATDGASSESKRCATGATDDERKACERPCSHDSAEVCEGGTERCCASADL